VVTLTSTVGLEGRLAGARLVQVLGSVFDDAMPLAASAGRRRRAAGRLAGRPGAGLAGRPPPGRRGRIGGDAESPGRTARIFIIDRLPPSVPRGPLPSSMPLIPAPRPVDLSAFAAPQDQAGVRYGLPRYVHFCKRCVISNQRPNSAVEYQHTKDSKKATINFDDEGICDACRFAEQKQATIDWKQREDQLAALCDKFRSKSGYDCLLPGSGGKDSFYASHLLKTRFGMHPLTVTWAPHVYTEWGWRNFQAWLHAGFDNELTTPNGRVHRLLTRLAVENLFHPFQAFMFGQKSLAPKMAILHDIPFVVYGENEAEYGNPIGDTSSAQRDWSYFTASDKSQIYLGGTSIQSLYDDYGLEPQDLLPYLPADPVQIRRRTSRCTTSATT
jgi:N-acetyl sugar amidotransferase